MLSKSAVEVVCKLDWCLEYLECFKNYRILKNKITKRDAKEFDWKLFNKYN